jgi:hypothetical protein
MSDKPQMSRWLAVILALSLALNLLMIGAASAYLARWRQQPLEQTDRMVLRQLTRRMDADDAHTMRQAVAGHRAQIVSAYRDYRQSLRALLTALQASPRSDDQVQAAIADTRDKRNALGDAVFDAALSGLEQVSPAGREALLERQR